MFKVEPSSATSFQAVSGKGCYLLQRNAPLRINLANVVCMQIFSPCLLIPGKSETLAAKECGDKRLNRH